jgi:hypothetical protein
MAFKQLTSGIAIQTVNDPDTAITDTTYYPADGSFIDVSQYDGFSFFIAAGGLDTQLVFAVYENSTAASAGSTAITGATVTIAATGDDKWYMIEVDAQSMTPGHRYVSLYGTGAAGGNDYAYIAFMGHNARNVAVTQGSTKGSIVIVAS